MSTPITPTEAHRDLAILMPAYNTEQRAQLIAEFEARRRAVLCDRWLAS